MTIENISHSVWCSCFYKYSYPECGCAGVGVAGSDVRYCRFLQKLRPTHWWGYCKQKRDPHLCRGLDKPFIILLFVSVLTDRHLATSDTSVYWRTGLPHVTWAMRPGASSRSWTFSSFCPGRAQYVIDSVMCTVWFGTHIHTLTLEASL